MSQARHVGITHTCRHGTRKVAVRITGELLHTVMGSAECTRSVCLAMHFDGFQWSFRSWHIAEKFKWLEEEVLGTRIRENRVDNLLQWPVEQTRHREVLWGNGLVSERNRYRDRRLSPTILCCEKGLRAAITQRIIYRFPVHPSKILHHKILTQQDILYQIIESRLRLREAAVNASVVGILLARRRQRAQPLDKS